MVENLSGMLMNANQLMKNYPDLSPFDLRILISRYFGWNPGMFEVHRFSTIEDLGVVCWLERRKYHEPLAYILGDVEFGGLCLEISHDVLIPRYETEILLDYAIKAIHNKGWQNQPFVCVDVCAGSGCLGLAIKHCFPLADVTLIDICPQALSIANKNAQKYQLEISLLEGDMLDAFQGDAIDMFLCNPPYVSREEYMHLDTDVRAFEPALALVGGESGLEFYERLSRCLYPRLNDRGMAILEIGHTQKQSCLDLFAQNPWKSIDCKRDFAGHDRVFFLEKDC